MNIATPDSATPRRAAHTRQVRPCHSISGRHLVRLALALALPFAALSTHAQRDSADGGDESAVALATESEPIRSVEAAEIVRIESGPYVLQSSATRSDVLPRESAAAHGLPWSSNAVILNLSVRRAGTTVPAQVEARATNLAEQVRDVEMHETRANDMVAYLGVIEIAPREVLTFDISVLPEGESEPIPMRYRSEFLPQIQ